MDGVRDQASTFSVASSCSNVAVVVLFSSSVLGENCWGLRNSHTRARVNYEYEMEQFFGAWQHEFFLTAFGGTLLYKNLSPVPDVDASSLADCVIGVARFMQNKRLKK